MNIICMKNNDDKNLIIDKINNEIIKALFCGIIFD